jgi:hypothetical protein
MAAVSTAVTSAEKRDRRSPLILAASCTGDWRRSASSKARRSQATVRCPNCPVQVNWAA